MSLLEVEGLTTHINIRKGVVRAVDGVSFSVEPGETVGLVGESGCGKSMTGHSLMRLLPPGGHIVSGSVRFDGRDLLALDERAMRAVRGNEISMVFQDPMTSLNPSMTIGQQIAEAVELHRPGVRKKDALERAAEVLASVGMPRPSERLNDHPHQLSGGLRQRVLIAMALACEPRLIIADEPTTALDVTIQAQILDLIDGLRERLGMAVVLITHDMGVIAGRTDRTFVMYAGQIIEQASTSELFARTRHQYTKALLGSIPQIDMDPRQQLRSIAGLPPDLANPPPGCRFAARCPAAQDRCREEVPDMTTAGPGHRFACFYPAGTGTAAPADVLPAAGSGDTAVVADPAVMADLAAADPAVAADLAAAGVSVAGFAAPQPAAAPSLAAGPLPGAGDGPGGRPVLLRLEDVSKEFSITAGLMQRKVGSLQAVNKVNLEVRAGETVGLVGESGCGKTTVGRMMVALERPSSGRILLGDADLATLKAPALRAIRADMQLMFQDPYASLNPRMRVGELIRDPLRVQHRGTAKEQLARVQELLSEVGLEPRAAERFPHEFSGGQRQRIGLARALALQPRLIVADEPVSALDASIRSQVLNLMKRLQRAHGLAYLIISHDLAVVRYMADRIAVMYLGKLVEVGEADDIYRRTAHPYTEALLQAIPIPDPAAERAKRGKAIAGELPSPRNPPSGCVFHTRCPRAQALCSAQVPALRPFGGEHHAACHFPLETAAAPEPGVGLGMRP